MSVPTDHEIATAMITCGGAFAAQLGKAFLMADPTNQATIKNAFPGLWADYADLAKRRRDERLD